jgi:thioesterase domain-containing protein
MAPTVQEFASLMEDQRQPATTSSLLAQKASSVPAVQDPSYLVELQRGEGQKAIFCFMFAGGFRGEFSTFAGLAPMIGRRHTFYGVIARGTDGKSNSHRSVEEMAAAYIQQIKTAQPQGPYFLIGECFSAPVAYETARQLLNQGEGVAMLAFLDGRVPGTTMNRILGSRITARVRYVLAILRETSIYLRYRVIREEVQVIKKTHGKDWLRHLFTRIRRTLSKKTSIHAVAWGKTPSSGTSGTSGTMSGSADRTSKQLHRASKNYGLAVRRYECRPYAGKITILASTEFLESNPTMGWRHVRDLEIHEIPGKHETYYRNNKQMVAGFLKEIIEKAEQEAGQAQTSTTSPRR